MIALLETVGLGRLGDAPDDGSAVFAGRSGRLAVAPADGAEAGLATLGCQVPDVAKAVAELSRAGLDVTLARRSSAGVLRHPGGATISLERHPDGTAAPGAAQRIAASMDVVAIWYSDDLADDAGFFAHLGFTGTVDNPWWCSLRAADHRGVIGLHARPARADAAPASPGRPAVVQVGLETSEPLDALAVRLRAAGHDDARVLVGEAGPHVELLDPDGRPLEIHLTA